MHAGLLRQLSAKPRAIPGRCDEGGLGSDGLRMPYEPRPDSTVTSALTHPDGTLNPPGCSLIDQSSHDRTPAITRELPLRCWICSSAAPSEDVPAGRIQGAVRMVRDACH